MLHRHRILDPTMPSGPRSKSPSGNHPGARLVAWIALGTTLAVASAFLFSYLSRSRSKRPASAGQIQTQQQIFSQYAGSARCRDCHRTQYELWTGSHHQLAERNLQPQQDNRAFVPARAIHHGSQTSQTILTNGQFQIITLSLSGHPEAQTIARVIGVDPLQQFLVPAPGGRWQTLELAFHPATGQWFDIYGAEDRKPGEWGHWTGRGMTWNSMCAACHNTRLQKNYHEPTDSYRTAMAEMSVGCEACHGPMNSHAQWQEHHSRRPDPTVHKLNADQILDTCGSCHSRRFDLTGDFKPGDSFFDHFILTIPDSTETYYADGQVHEEDYEFGSFLSSRMHAAGVRCLDCHEPHSGKTRFPGNQLCLRCHNGSYPKSPLIDPAAHTFHKPSSPGAQCVNCHMPQTAYMQRHLRHDHGFTIPDPWLTQQLGIPNACNRCHTDKPAAWAAETAQTWYGAKMERSTRQRALLIAAARKNDPSAQRGLLDLLQSSETLYWKAVAAALLESWNGSQQTAAALLALVNSPQPLLRFASLHSLSRNVEALGPAAQNAFQHALEDPSRAVRFQAALALGQQLDPNSLAGSELLRTIDFNSDQPTGQLQKGVFFLEQGQPESAVASLKKAVAWDPNSATFHEELAVALSAAGQNGAALAEMQTACRLNPNDPESQYRLGLASNEAGRLQEASAALESAVKLDPLHSRAWYNLGLLRNTLGDRDSALDALLRAESISPQNPEIPYARATILARAGVINDAKTAARRSLEINPNFAPAKALLDSLP